MVSCDSPEIVLHAIYLSDKALGRCSTQESINELFVQDMQKWDNSEIANEVADSWFTI